MKKYWLTFKIGWQDAFEYRTEMIISLIGWVVRLLIAIFIWSAVFQGKQQIGEYSFEGIIIYFIVLSIVTTFVFSRIGFQVGEDIHTGDFSNYLIKPISYTGYQIVSEFSRNILRTIIGAIVFLTILLFLYPNLFGTLELARIPTILLSLLFAYVINAFISMSIGLSGFWVVNSNRLMYIYFAIITAISGMTVPLDLFPPQAVEILYYLPFSYIFFLPVKIIQSAQLDPVFLTKVFTGQAAFLVGLGLLNYCIYRLGVKKYEAVGR